MIFVSRAHFSASDTLFGMNDLVAHSVSSFVLNLVTVQQDATYSVYCISVGGPR